MVNSHWVFKKNNKSFTPNLDKFGFVYIITNTKNSRAYIGCKQYFHLRNKKKVESNWKDYTGSSQYLNDDIKKIGKKHFIFEVIGEYKNKRSLRYYEMKYQMKHNVLTTMIEGTNQRLFYNAYVGGKFFPPIEAYVRGDEHPNAIGPHKITFNKPRKEIIVANLHEFATLNGYQPARLYQVKQGYNIDYKKPGNKNTRNKHKDIIKVEEM